MVAMVAMVQVEGGWLLLPDGVCNLALHRPQRRVKIPSPYCNRSWPKTKGKNAASFGNLKSLIKFTGIELLRKDESLDKHRATIKEIRWVDKVERII